MVSLTRKEKSTNTRKCILRLLSAPGRYIKHKVVFIEN